ncbi:uncharacterized protein LOC114540962 [Dendronephthya gigantea]|uniref:uncharacterized protein LOC114540962 n=1 Tax=Dendronephthya gigantea TaxID=151771 RepID=UPI00106D4B70|nr:uncharacterized protein LOC114540962 [Dendronephthya gigantea]
MFVSRLSYLIGNLAFADCLNGVFLIVLQQPILDIRYVTKTLKAITLPMVWTAYCASYAILFLMAAERIVILLLPLVSSMLLTIHRTVFGIFVAWLISIGGGVAVYYKQYYAKFYICLFIEICTLGFVVSHVFILWALHKREKRRVNEYSSQVTPPPQVPCSESLAQRKATMVVTSLLVVLILSCLPSFICIQLFVINNSYDNTLASKINVELYSKFRAYSSAFNYVYFFSNPIIYAWRLRMYRKAFYILLERILSLILN